MARLRSRGQPDVVFVWIPKTAGTSLWDVIASAGGVKCPSVERLNRVFPQRGLVTFAHMDYTELIDTGLVDSAFDQRAYKFAVVRNPFDRAVSLYKYLQRRQIVDENASFAEFVGLLNSNSIEPIGLYNSNGLSQCNPQSAWIFDSENNSIVDEVFRFERLGDVASKLRELLDTSIDSLPHRNISNESSYREYYSATEERIVREIYDRDFQLLGYTPSL